MRVKTSADEMTFREDLLASEILVEAGALGLYHRSDAFESVIEALEARCSIEGAFQHPRRLAMSPVMARSTLVSTGYAESFPNLMATLHSFTDDASNLQNLRSRAAAGVDWSDLLSPIDLALCPAACHGVYPLYAGHLLHHDGVVLEITSTCFRHEPSEDPARMQSFRQLEFVYLGDSTGAQAFRDSWLRRGQELLSSLGLNVEAVLANDPFFGRGSALMGQGQIDKKLKYEIVAEIAQPTPNAVASANCHEDHFGQPFAIRSSDGQVAHSACIGFGLDRIALALFRRHGLEYREWPLAVREQLTGK